MIASLFAAIVVYFVVLVAVLLLLALSWLERVRPGEPYPSEFGDGDY